MKIEIENLIEDFCKVAMLAGIKILSSEITYQYLNAPHKPSKLLEKKKAVYIFLFQGRCLKVGKVGAKSNPRFQNQHYKPNSSKSNLAKSLLSDQTMVSQYDLNENKIENWIKSNTDRINVFIDVEHNMFLLPLLESFLQCRLQPLYEGFQSQR